MSTSNYFQMERVIPRGPIVNILSCLFSGTTLLIIVTTMILVLSVSDETMVLVNDAQKSLSDLQELVPKVRRTLLMLEMICHDPYFQSHYNISCI